MTKTLFLSLLTRSAKVEGGTSSSPGNWCIFGLLLGLAQLLLHGALGLVLFWVIHYRGGFGWRDTPEFEFNYHPVLMIGGFIYLVGNGNWKNISRKLSTKRATPSHRCRCCRVHHPLFHLSRWQEIYIPLQRPEKVLSRRCIPLGKCS